jgi:hypothetical protein
MPGERIRLTLRELDRCTDDALYEVLISRIIAMQTELPAEGSADDRYRVTLVLADHASGQGGGSAAQARMAHSALETSCDASVLDDLIRRSCDQPGGGLRATQVLLQMREQPVPAILAHLAQQTDPRRSALLSAMILALGENAVPALIRAITRPTGGRVQRAVRLAGELQSPKLVPTLYSVLSDSGPALRREAARALVNIGNQEACDVLIKALSSRNEDLPQIAAHCLGLLANGRAAEPLLNALQRVSIERSSRLAVEIIRSLGLVGGDPSEVARRLSVVLETRGVLGKRKRRAPKLAALDVLEQLGSNGAQQAVTVAISDPDPEVCARAREILTSGPGA